MLNHSQWLQPRHVVFLPTMGRRHQAFLGGLIASIIIFMPLGRGVFCQPMGGQFNLNGGFKWAKSQNNDGSYMKDDWLEDTFNRYVDQVGASIYNLRLANQHNNTLSTAGLVLSGVMAAMAAIWKVGICFGRRGAVGAVGQPGPAGVALAALQAPLEPVNAAVDQRALVV